MQTEFQGPSGGLNKAAAANTSGLWGTKWFERPDWHARAACGRNGVLGDDAGARVRIMFPERGGDPTKEALAACAVCQVVDECERANQTIPLAHAREVGVWFGTSGRMRRGTKVPVRCRCGVKFERDTPRQVYCSDGCRIEARRVTQARRSVG